MKRFKTQMAAAALLLLGALAFAKKEEMTVLHTGTGTKISNPVPDEETPGHWATINELIEQQGRKFSLLHNWGVAWGSITRIQKQSNRSNFVWNDQLVGAYYEMTTNNFLTMGHYVNVDLFARNAFFYPYSYTFNKIKQEMTQTLLYGFDFFTGVKFSMNIWDWVTLSAKPGAHLYYQLHDKWHYLHLGAGLGLEVEMPISSRWSFNIGGIWTWDNANLGSNQRMRPFDYAWEYQAQLGFRYSKKKLNPKSFVKYSPRPPKTKKVRALKPKTDKPAVYQSPSKEAKKKKSKNKGAEAPAQSAAPAEEPKEQAAPAKKSVKPAETKPQTVEQINR